jgi:hypothetical protein
VRASFTPMVMCGFIMENSPICLGVTLPESDSVCAAPRYFVGTGQVQRRIISWELARGVQRNLTRGQL